MDSLAVVHKSPGEDLKSNRRSRLSIRTRKPRRFPRIDTSTHISSEGQELSFIFVLAESSCGCLVAIDDTHKEIVAENNGRTPMVLRPR